MSLTSDLRSRMMRFAAPSRRQLTAGILCLAATIGIASPLAADFGMTPQLQERLVFTVDVAEDMNKYAEHRTAVGEEPLPGSSFVTEGRIFPAGTIPEQGGDQFDPNQQGAQGTWFCKGSFLVKGSEFANSVLGVVTDQIYFLPNDKKMLATTGVEGNGTILRVVTGGAGAFFGYIGEQRQEFLGFNKTGGVNLRVTFSLKRAANLF